MVCNYGVNHRWHPVIVIDAKRTLWQCTQCKNVGEGRPADPLEVTVSSIKPPQFVTPKPSIGEGITIIAQPVGATEPAGS